eukprot:15199400-Alexandrium_andersonii.AAC.1
MSASLVGSEMCIRDRHKPWAAPGARGRASDTSGYAVSLAILLFLFTVSYTHLTLPTICSV